MYTFTVDQNEANMIIGGLGELPAKYSLPLIQKLQAMAALQPQEVLPEQKTEETATEEKPAEKEKSELTVIEGAADKPITASAATGEEKPADIPAPDTREVKESGGDGASV